MTIVGLHPEELLDKWLNGELSAAEDERLRQHLQACAVCRFEHAARRDFQAEALAHATHPPPALALRPLLALEDAPLETPVVASPRRRRRTRRLVLGLAAAALITASGAVAASVAGKARWQSLGSVFSPPPAPASQPASQAPAQKQKLKLSSGASAPAVPSAAAGGDSLGAPALASAIPPSRRAQLPGREATQERFVPARRIAAPPAETGTDSGKEAPVKPPRSAAILFAEANQARRSGDVGRASALYYALQEQYAGSPEAELSRVTLALLLLDTGDAQGALAGFERYLAGTSRGLEAEALVGRARALGRLGRRALEAAAWQEVQRKYPRSIYGRQAAERLSSLGQP